MNQLQAYKKIMILSMIVVIAASANLMLSDFCLAQDLQELENFVENSENAENLENTEIVENEETAEIGDNISKISEDSEAEALDGLVDTIIFSSKSFWEFRALPCLTKAGDWFRNLWQSSIEPQVNIVAEWTYNAWTKKIKPFAQNTIDQAKNFFGENKRIIENRKIDLGEEIEKEEQEIKQESPYLYKVIEKYRRFKEYLWGTSPETNENSE